MLSHFDFVEDKEVLATLINTRKSVRFIMVSIDDTTGWLVDSELAKFLLLSTAHIGYMAMLAYTFLHGT